MARLNGKIAYLSLFLIIILSFSISGTHREETDGHRIGGSFEELFLTNTPQLRQDHSMVTDENGTIYLFGGYNGDYRLSDLHKLDLDTGVWNQLNPLNQPTPRMGASMIYDPQRDGLMTVGGSTASSTVTDEVHFFNISSGNWEEKSYTYAPSARYHHAMAYDFNNNITYLHGGVKFNPTEALSDLWSYNATDDSWSEISTLTQPDARYLHSMIFLPKLDALMIFGGAGTSHFSDTWLYFTGNNTWVELQPDKNPVQRVNFAMTYSADFNSAVLHGGLTEGTWFQDTWLFNATTLNWVTIPTTGEPSARAGHEMVYTSGGLFIFGGTTGSITSQSFKLDLYVQNINLETVTTTSTVTTSETDIVSSTETETITSTDTVVLTNYTELTNFSTIVHKTTLTINDTTVEFGSLNAPVTGASVAFLSTILLMRYRKGRRE